MKLVVGLGNPGRQYEGTRHNVGFEVIDRLAANPRVGRAQMRFDALAAESEEFGQKVLYVKPQTFMNLSGRSVRQFLDFYKLTAADVLVVCDDMNLPLGKLRVKARGSAGGHNGLKDIERHLGTQEYARLRVGVGAPERQAWEDFVLSRFRPSEKAQVDEGCDRAVQAVLGWLRDGVDAVMNQFNPEPTAEKKPARSGQAEG